MSLLPPGISSSFRRELCMAASKEEIFTLLRKNPENLLKFFSQSVSDILFYVQNKPFLDSIWKEVTHLALTQVLPWNSVAKTYDLTIKLMGLETLFPQDMFVKQDELAVGYSRMIFMHECPTLRKEWMEHPEDCDFTLNKFAPKLKSLGELNYLYSLLWSNNYSRVSFLKLEQILFLILQAKEWGCDKVFVELQKQFSSRLSGIVLPFDIYATTFSNDLDIIKKRVQELLDNAQYYKDDQLDIYYHFTFFLDDEEDMAGFNEEDKRNLAQNYLVNLPQFGKSIPAVRLEWMTMVMDSDGALVCYRSTQDLVDIAIIKNKINKPIIIDKSRFKKLIFCSQYQMRDLSVVGMIRYFDQVETVEFVEYEIKDDLIPLISQGSSNLKKISFIRCSMDEVHYIELEYMTRLTSLSFCEQDISAISFTSLRRIKSLENVVFLKCRIIIPTEEDHFWEITSLNLNGSIFKNDDFIRLLKMCRHLKVLYCEECDKFNLEDYPYPEKLEELYLSVKHIENAVRNGTVPALDRYTGLRKLSIRGEIVKELKPIVIKYLNKYKISFQR